MPQLALTLLYFIHKHMTLVRDALAPSCLLFFFFFHQSAHKHTVLSKEQTMLTCNWSPLMAIKQTEKAEDEL